MATRFRPFSGPSSGGGGDFTSVSPLVIPELMDLFQRIQGGVPSVPSFEPIFNRVAGMIPEQTQSFESILGQGTGSPLIQQVMQMLLPSLATGEEQAREALTDRFRASGGLRSGAYGVAAPRLEGELAAKRGGVMSQLISSLLGPLISGSLQAQEQSFLPARTLMQLLPSLLQSQENQFLPSRTLVDLISALTPTVIAGQGGGGAGAGGGEVSDPFGILEAARAGQDFQSNPYLGGSFADASSAGGTYDPFSPLNPGKTYAEKLDFSRYGISPGGGATASPGGVTTGSLNDIFLDPFSNIYSDFGGGDFEY